MNMASTPTTGLSRAIDAYRAAPYVSGIGTPHLTLGEEAMLDRLRESTETALEFAEWELPDGKRFSPIVSKRIAASTVVMQNESRP
jgi:hypothetical protein